MTSNNAKLAAMSNGQPGGKSKPDRREQAAREFARLLAAACQRGYHGTATLTVSLQDGHIQHLRVSTERMVK